jgi:protein-S-isoprenylcysteine O-methyltransferase Ste14
MIDFEIQIKILVILLLVVFFVARSKFTKHHKQFKPRFLIKYVIFVLLAIFYLSPIADVFIIAINFKIRLLVGLPIIFLGMALFFWAHEHLLTNWSPVIEKKFAKSRYLVKTGPYKYVLHPIYSASIICIMGFFILTANWLIMLIPTIILLLFYFIKVPKEEDELIRNFGKDYKEFMKTRGRFIPRIKW